MIGFPKTIELIVLSLLLICFVAVKLFSPSQLQVTDFFLAFSGQHLVLRPSVSRTLLIVTSEKQCEVSISFNDVLPRTYFVS
jgi:hypothetical protein